MRLIVLTTESYHHAYFVRELQNRFSVTAVLLETRMAKAPFATAHPFEDVRDEFERQRFFGGRHSTIDMFAPVQAVPSMKSQEAVDDVRALAPDVILVFGTGKLPRELISICPDGIVNLHGGDPEEYRGLDSHLWATYHKDYSALVTCVHRVNAELDDGELVLKAPLSIAQGMRLAELRSVNADVCLELSTSALDMYARYGRFLSSPQRRRGRYYSFMPSELKEICVRNFARFSGAEP